MLTIKIVVFSALTLGTLQFLWYARGTPFEKKLLSRALVAGTLIKVTACVLVYTLWPSLIQHSDARNYYLPQTEELLAGRLPYRDFETAYAPFFHVLLAPFVAAWHSPGAICLLMLGLETATLWLYLARSRGHHELHALRTACLYAFSPVSCYWVALSGHNGAVIAFFVLWSLVLAERRQSVRAGIAAACALLFCKLLGALSWPGVALFDRNDRLRRTLPLVVTSVFLVALHWMSADLLVSFHVQFNSSTTGNLWSLMSPLMPGLNAGPLARYLPLLVFGVVFVPLWVAFARRGGDAGRFDATSAFVAGTNLLFMALSRKAFSFYLVMSLLLVVHTLLLRRRPMLQLVPLLYLLSISWLEETHSASDPAIITLEAIRLVCYGYLAVICFRAALEPRERAPAEA